MVDSTNDIEGAVVDDASTMVASSSNQDDDTESSKVQLVAEESSPQVSARVNDDVMLSPKSDTQLKSLIDTFDKHKAERAARSRTKARGGGGSGGGGPPRHPRPKIRSVDGPLPTKLREKIAVFDKQNNPEMSTSLHADNNMVSSDNDDEEYQPLEGGGAGGSSTVMPPIPASPLHHRNSAMEITTPQTTLRATVRQRLSLQQQPNPIGLISPNPSTTSATRSTTIRSTSPVGRLHQERLATFDRRKHHRRKGSGDGTTPVVNISSHHSSAHNSTGSKNPSSHSLSGDEMSDTDHLRQQQQAQQQQAAKDPLFSPKLRKEKMAPYDPNMMLPTKSFHDDDDFVESLPMTPQKKTIQSEKSPRLSKEQIAPFDHPNSLVASTSLHEDETTTAAAAGSPNKPISLPSPRLSKDRIAPFDPNVLRSSSLDDGTEDLTVAPSKKTKMPRRASMPSPRLSKDRIAPFDASVMVDTMPLHGGTDDNEDFTQEKSPRLSKDRIAPYDPSLVLSSSEHTAKDILQKHKQEEELVSPRLTKDKIIPYEPDELLQKEKIDEEHENRRRQQEREHHRLSLPPLFGGNATKPPLAASSPSVTRSKLERERIAAFERANKAKSNQLPPTSDRRPQSRRRKSFDFNPVQDSATESPEEKLLPPSPRRKSLDFEPFVDEAPVTDVRAAMRNRVTNKLGQERLAEFERQNRESNTLVAPNTDGRASVRGRLSIPSFDSEAKEAKKIMVGKLKFPNQKNSPKDDDIYKIPPIEPEPLDQEESTDNRRHLSLPDIPFGDGDEAKVVSEDDEKPFGVADTEMERRQIEPIPSSLHQTPKPSPGRLDVTWPPIRKNAAKKKNLSVHQLVSDKAVKSRLTSFEPSLAHINTVEDAVHVIKGAAKDDTDISSSVYAQAQKAPPPRSSVRIRYAGQASYLIDRIAGRLQDLGIEFNPDLLLQEDFMSSLGVSKEEQESLSSSLHHQELQEQKGETATADDDKGQHLSPPPSPRRKLQQGKKTKATRDLLMTPKTRIREDNSWYDEDEKAEKEVEVGKLPKHTRPDIWVTPYPVSPTKRSKNKPPEQRSWRVKRVWNFPEFDAKETEYKVENAELMSKVKSLLGVFGANPYNAPWLTSDDEDMSEKPKRAYTKKKGKVVEGTWTFSEGDEEALVDSEPWGMPAEASAVEKKKVVDGTWTFGVGDEEESEDVGPWGTQWVHDVGGEIEEPIPDAEWGTESKMLKRFNAVIDEHDRLHAPYIPDVVEEQITEPDVQVQPEPAATPIQKPVGGTDFVSIPRASKINFMKASNKKTRKGLGWSSPIMLGEASGGKGNGKGKGKKSKKPPDSTQLGNDLKAPVDGQWTYGEGGDGEINDSTPWGDQGKARKKESLDGKWTYGEGEEGEMEASTPWGTGDTPVKEEVADSDGPVDGQWAYGEGGDEERTDSRPWGSKAKLRSHAPVNGQWTYGEGDNPEDGGDTPWGDKYDPKGRKKEKMDGKWSYGIGDDPNEDNSAPWGHKVKDRSKAAMDGKWAYGEGETPSGGETAEPWGTKMKDRPKASMDGKWTYGEGEDPGNDGDNEWGHKAKDRSKALMDGKWAHGEGDEPASHDDSKPWGNKAKDRTKEPMDGKWGYSDGGEPTSEDNNEPWGTKEKGRTEEPMDGQWTYGEGGDEATSEDDDKPWGANAKDRTKGSLDGKWTYGEGEEPPVEAVDRPLEDVKSPMKSPNKTRKRRSKAKKKGGGTGWSNPIMFDEVSKGRSKADKPPAEGKPIAVEEPEFTPVNPDDLPKPVTTSMPEVNIMKEIEAPKIEKAPKVKKSKEKKMGNIADLLSPPGWSKVIFDDS